MTEVDLVVNCFERTYREVLGAGHIAAIVQDNAFAFASRTVLINNVEDRDDAAARADELVASGEITRWVFVADHLDAALVQCGLTRADLGPMPWFTDFALVAVTLDGPDWVCVWDADVRLREPVDWITPAVALMDRDRRILTANPNWEYPNLDEFTFEVVDGFHIGHGFSDQVYLGRRSDLGAPIYGERCISRWRYPLSHVGPIYESRIDAYLRKNDRYRATYAGAQYLHGAEMGTSWRDDSLLFRLRAARNHGVIRALKLLPWRPRHLRQL